MRPCFVLALVLAAQAAGAAEPALSTYGNGHYDYTVDYPAALLAPQGESDSGDGQVFQSADGDATMRVYAQFLMRDIPHQCDAVAQARERAGARVSYQLRKPGLTVASGELAPGRIFYAKGLKTSDRCLMLLIEYPAARRTQFDPLVGRIAASLRPGTGTKTPTP